MALALPRTINGRLIAWPKRAGEITDDSEWEVGPLGSLVHWCEEGKLSGSAVHSSISNECFCCHCFARMSKTMRDVYLLSGHCCDYDSLENNGPHTYEG
jgi:hypothetical protein